MSTITITLSEDALDRLKALAGQRGVTPEELAREGVESFLSDPMASEGGDASFEEDLDYLLDKNAELYRRLAR